MKNKNYKNLINETLKLLWDINGYKKENEVIDSLISEVFSKIEKEKFNEITNDIKRDIFNLPNNEKEIFEKALKIHGEKK